MSETLSETTLNMTRRFSAPPERVFDAFASVDAMKHWFGPDYCKVLDGEIDFQPGGDYRLHLLIENEKETDLVGRFLEIERPHRMSYTWAWKGQPEMDFGETVVTITLKAVEEGTELTLEQTGFPATEVRDRHNYGWNGSFDRLEKYFA